MIPLQSQCASLFGDPTAKGWEAKNVVRVPVPWNMSMGPTPIRVIPINKVAADSLAAVIKKIWDRCDHAQGAIHHAGCDCFSGSYYPGGRPIRGGKTLSMHSYALAVDINAPLNPLGAPVDRTLFKPDSLVVGAFKEEGWVWGGDWKGRRDAMHFQYAKVG